MKCLIDEHKFLGYSFFTFPTGKQKGKAGLTLWLTI